MTKSQEAKAIILGSFVMYLINALLDKQEQFNGTTVRLKQILVAKTRVANYEHYIVMSNTAWSNVIEQFKDENYHILIHDAVESLVFDNDNIMVAMFGKNIIPYASAFSIKQTRDGSDKQILKESRIITDALKKSVEKVVFDNKEIL